MTRLLILRALSDLPSELQEPIFRSIFPTKSQLLAKLDEQIPTRPEFNFLDATIVNFTHGDAKVLPLDDLGTREVKWLQMRCKLFDLKQDGGEVSDWNKDFDETLLISKRKRWMYDEKRRVIPLDLSTARWLTQAFCCVSCDVELEEDDEPDNPKEPICSHCRVEPNLDYEFWDRYSDYGYSDLEDPDDVLDFY